jgi:hypothetical protein
LESVVSLFNKSNVYQLEREKTMAAKEEFTKEIRYEMYSCAFCEFVQSSMGSERLEAIDEKKYLFHLKHVHNLEP